MNGWMDGYMGLEGRVLLISWFDVSLIMKAYFQREGFVVEERRRESSHACICFIELPLGWNSPFSACGVDRETDVWIVGSSTIR